MTSIAFFITSHGYGHAARAAAVMEVAHRIDPSMRFEIFTSVPRLFFETSVGADFGYHDVLTDAGLIQDTPTQENIPATLRALEKMYPFDADRLSQLAETITRLSCQLVVSDISPLGIAVARQADIPSVLVENFRWDWIYENYQHIDGRFTKHIHYLRDVFESADHLVQTEPVCVRHKADLTVPPISRSPRTNAAEVRSRLGIRPDDRAVYISMGGSNWDTSFLMDIQSQDGQVFIITGGSSGSGVPPQRQGNILFLDVDTYMPDVLAACDAVISKAGYSTLAEVYYAGIPFGYIARQQFQESAVLEKFIKTKMQGLKISEAEFYSGNFVRHVDELLSLPRIKRDRSMNGAEAVAKFLLRSAQRIAK